MLYANHVHVCVSPGLCVGPVEMDGWMLWLCDVWMVQRVVCACVCARVCVCVRCTAGLGSVVLQCVGLDGRRRVVQSVRVVRGLPRQRAGV